MRTLTAAAVLVLAACGAPTGPGTEDSGSDAGATADVEELSGTRLKNRFLLGDDGSRASLGFFDVMRNEACYFTQADDGKFRCMPAENMAYFASHFSDSACTVRVAEAQASCVAATYAYEFTSTCPALRSTYQVTGEFAPDAGLYRSNAAGGCLAETPNAAQRYYNVGTKLAPAVFVGATVKTEQ